tara:strand:- start:1016 stop:1627 length:612 start_codon:yes stop_codon:yes gene_type:complete
MTQETEFVISDPVQAEKPAILPGTEILKSPFTEAQNKAAGYAIRMEVALKKLQDLEESGFNPVNTRDFLVNNLPFDPRALENFLSSPKYKQYNRARIDFASAQLRQETGSTISPSEIVWIDQTYFPAYGDDEQTILEKREARDKALAAMIGIAGKAYDRVKAESMKSAVGFGSDDAKEYLLKKAEKDPELRRKLIEAGHIKDE